MHVELVPFSLRERAVLLRDIAAFWQHHAALVSKEETVALAQAEDTLKEWLGEGHTLFSIWVDGQQAGFLHLQRTGPIVMQLEDIFVQPPLRGRGIATAAGGSPQRSRAAALSQVGVRHAFACNAAKRAWPQPAPPQAAASRAYFPFLKKARRPGYPGRLAFWGKGRFFCLPCMPFPHLRKRTSPLHFPFSPLFSTQLHFPYKADNTFLFRQAAVHGCRFPRCAHVPSP